MSIMETVNKLSFTVDVMTDICIDITRLTTRLISLMENVDALYDCMTVLASHLVNPFIVQFHWMKLELFLVKSNRT